MIRSSVRSLSQRVRNKMRGAPDILATASGGDGRRDETIETLTVRIVVFAKLHCLTMRCDLRDVALWCGGADGGIAMKITLPIVVLAVAFSTPAFGQTQNLSCPMSQADGQRLAAIGYPDNAKQVMHLSLNKSKRSVVVWETYPGSTDNSRATYKAKFTAKAVSWTIGGGSDDDDPPAHDSLDLVSDTLSTTDPIGDVGHWDCKAD
jgi:hypothetical protein